MGDPLGEVSSALSNTWLGDDPSRALVNSRSDELVERQMTPPLQAGESNMAETEETGATTQDESSGDIACIFFRVRINVLCTYLAVQGWFAPPCAGEQQPNAHFRCPTVRPRPGNAPTATHASTAMIFLPKSLSVSTGARGKWAGILALPGAPSLTPDPALCQGPVQAQGSLPLPA